MERQRLPTELLQLIFEYFKLAAHADDTIEQDELINCSRTHCRFTHRPDRERDAKQRAKIASEERRIDQERYLTLKHIARASKMCYSICRPILYHTIDCRGAKASILIPLLRVMVKDDSVVPYIRTLLLPAPNEQWLRGEQAAWQQLDDGSRSSLLGRAAQTLPDDVVALLTHGCNTGDRSAYALLLLIHTTHLEELSIWPPTRTTNNESGCSMHAMFKWVYAQQGRVPFLTRLHTIRLTYSTYWYYAPMSDLVTKGVLALPSLARFFQARGGLKQQTDTWLNIEGLYSRNSIRIESTVISAAFLRSLLRIHPTLKIFECVPCIGGDQDASPNWPQLGDALRTYGLNLERLIIDTGWGPRFTNVDLCWPIGSLLQLSHLRHMELNANAFWGAICQPDVWPESSDIKKRHLDQILPRSLEILRIHEAHSENCFALAMLISSLPLLRIDLYTTLKQIDYVSIRSFRSLEPFGPLDQGWHSVFKGRIATFTRRRLDVPSLPGTGIIEEPASA